MAAVTVKKNEGVAKPKNSSIEVAGAQFDNFAHLEKKAEAERKAKQEQAMLSAILMQISQPSFVTDNVVPLISDTIKDAIKDALEATAKVFPEHNVAADKAVFANAQANISVEAKKITFAAAPIVKEAAATKPAFTEDAAYAMAKWAIANQEMIKKGIKLRGSAADQALLRAAIEKVNAQQPEGQKLKIRGENIAPIMNAVAAPKAENDNAPEHNITSKSEQQDETAAQNLEAPRKSRFNIFGHIAKFFTRKPVDKAAKAEAEAAQERKVISRRAVLTGGGSTVLGLALLGASTKDSEAGRSAHYYDQKMKSGLYNPDMTLKSEGKKKKTSAERKKRKNAEGKSTSSKKETAAQRKARLKKEKEAARKEALKKKNGRKKDEPKPETRAERKARLKREKDAARKEQEKAKKAAEKKKPVEDKKAAKKAEAEEKRAEKKASSNEKVSGNGGVILYNRHTKERMYLDFSRIGSCRSQFNKFARDHYSGASWQMDAGLLRYIFKIVTNLRSQGYAAEQVDLISGYRTEDTNINVLKNPSGSNSMHCKGKALDMAVSGVKAKTLYKTACNIGCDGVGYYGKKGYVHVDTGGPGRRW